MDPLLLAHIGTGSLGFLSGFTAMFTRKGARLHRIAGVTFFFSMGGSAALGGVLALQKPEMITVLAAAFTVYKIASSWVAARREQILAWPFEVIGLFLGLTIAAFGGYGGYIASMSETGLNGYGPEPFYFFGGIAGLAALMDLSVLLRKGIKGRQRIARHLWRMGAALFIATGSFFAQLDALPAIIEETPILNSPDILVLALMVGWLIYVLVTKRFKDA